MGFLLRIFAIPPKIVSEDESPSISVMIGAILSGVGGGYLTSLYLFPDGADLGSVIEILLFSVVYSFIAVLFIMFFLHISRRTIWGTLLALSFFITFVLESGAVTILYLTISSVPFLFVYFIFNTNVDLIREFTLLSVQSIAILLVIIVPVFLYVSQTTENHLIFLVNLFMVVSAGTAFYKQVGTEF
jgi:hypothetical protein